MTDMCLDMKALRLSLARYVQRFKGESTMKSQTMTVESSQPIEEAKAGLSRRVSNGLTTQSVPYTYPGLKLVGEKAAMNKITFMNRIVACLVTTLLCICTNQVGAQNINNDIKREIEGLIHENNMRLVSTKSERDYFEGRIAFRNSTLAARGEIINHMRGQIHDINNELRTNLISAADAYMQANQFRDRVFQIYNVNNNQLTIARVLEHDFNPGANFKGGLFMTFAYENMMDRFVKQAQIKNQQARIRHETDALKNAIRNYTRLAKEVTIIEANDEVLKKQLQIVIQNPNALPNMRILAAINPVNPKPLINQNNNHINLGNPTAGDTVTGKLEKLYIIMIEQDAAELMARPPQFPRGRLLDMIKKKEAAILNKGESAEVLIEGNHLLKIRITDANSKFLNFVGWVDKNRLKIMEIPDKEPIKIPVVKKFMVNIEPLNPKAPEEMKQGVKLVKLAGLPAIGSIVTPKSLAITWKHTADIKDYLEGNENKRIYEDALERKEVDKIDDSILGRVVKMDNVGIEVLIQINIEAPNHPLDKTKWWVRGKDTTVCKVNP